MRTQALWLSLVVLLSGCNEPLTARGELGAAVSGAVARVMTDVATAPAQVEEPLPGDDLAPLEDASPGGGDAVEEDRDGSEAGELGVYDEEPPVPDGAEGEPVAGGGVGGGGDALDAEAGEGEIDGADPEADAAAVVYDAGELLERIERLEVDRDLMALQIEALEQQVAALDERVYDLEELSDLLFATVTTHQQRLASIQVALLAITVASGQR